MMIGIYGTSLNGDSRYMLTEFPNGNVILFDRNMETPEQVKQLNADIQKTVKQSTGVPAFIGIDQEGGQVVRMENYMPPMPASRSRFSTKSLRYSYWSSTVINLSISSCGCRPSDVHTALSSSYTATLVDVHPGFMTNILFIAIGFFTLHFSLFP